MSKEKWGIFIKLKSKGETMFPSVRPGRKYCVKFVRKEPEEAVIQSLNVHSGCANKISPLGFHSFDRRKERPVSQGAFLKVKIKGGRKHFIDKNKRGEYREDYAFY